MSIYRSDDPMADFDRWEAAQNKRLAKCPICSECDQPIQDEKCYCFNGELICEDCLNLNHKVDTDDYME